MQFAQKKQENHTCALWLTKNKGFARKTDKQDSFGADLDEPLPDLPAEYPRVVPLVLLDLVLHFGGGNARLATPNHPRPYAPCLLIPDGNFQN